MLFHLTDDWELEFAASGAEALEKLAAGKFDVVVSDMRMPGMDGATLLGKICHKYPDIVRIVLSGHADLEMALRAAPVAHQYLLKPCKAGVIQEVVERAGNLRALLGSDNVKYIAGRITELPAAPSIHLALMEKMTDPDATAEDVSKIVEQDPALTARLIQCVNSAFFSTGGRARTVSQAVVKLGFQMVRNLVMTMEVFGSQMTADSSVGLSASAVQAHSLGVSKLAMQMFNAREASDQAFLAGMLHDIGKLLLAVAQPEEYTETRIIMEREQLKDHVAEQEIFQVTHAEIGAYLLGLWGLPYPVVEAVAYHHEPTTVQQVSGLDTLSAIHIADDLVNGREPDQQYLEKLGVEEKYDSWQETARELAPV